MEGAMDIPSSSESLTSRSTESMEIDTLSVMENSPPRSATPFNNAGDEEKAHNPMSTDTEKSIIVTAPSMESADSPTVINGHDEEQAEILPVHSKRKRTSTINYDDSSYGKAMRVSPIDAPVKRSKPGKSVRGVIIGVWRDSDQADDENKHVIFGFIDIHDRLRTRIYGMNRRGEEVVGNIPSGAGGCWVTFERVIFDSHLASLTAAEIKEYVKIRSETKPEPTPEERDDADAKAVLEAKVIVAQQEAANPGGKPVVHRPSPNNRQSLSRPSLPRNSLQKTPSFQAVNAADIQTPKGSPTADIKPYGVLLGYWLDSEELRIEDKHAVYGVLSETDCFRVKVQRLTRDGRYVDSNFPVGAGALWLSYKKVVLEPHLTSLTRPEVKEYCRIRQREQENKETEKERKANELRAVNQARINVAEKDQGAGVDVTPNPELEIRHSARSENRTSARHQAEAEAATERVRKEKAEARERQHEKTRKEVALAEEIMQQSAQIELKNNLKKLNKVWVAQQAVMNHTTPATSSRPETTDGEVKYHHGIKYERKQNGPFQGKLVSQAQILSIDGEDYVEYRILTKPSF